MPFNNYTGSLSTIPLQHLVDIAETYGDLEPIINAGGKTQTVALSCANTVMNAICSTAFPHKWNEYNISPIYSNSLQQDYAVVLAPGLSGTLTLTQVLQISVSQGTALYAGTMPDGAFGGYVGVPFVITGFTNAGNNGTFMCVASSAAGMAPGVQPGI